MAKKNPSSTALSKPPAPDPQELKKLVRSIGMRVGIPLLVVWIVIILIGHPYGFIVGAVLTAAALGLVGWAWFYMRRSKRVANILRDADMGTASGRQEALKRLEDGGAAKGEPTALFAKAQLLMQEDPRKALAVLEQINLDKVMAPMADEARGQRAMIHLLFGEVDKARVLADAINLTRHEQIKSRAALAAVVAESWARSGQGKKASETLDLFDPENAELVDVKPQLLRARCFAAAAQSDVKRMRHALRRLSTINPQLLAGFVQKKVHPLLEKEAKQMLMQSGVVPKKMVRQRM